MTADTIFKCVKCTKCIFPLKEHRLQKVTQKEKQTHVACTLYVLLLLQLEKNSICGSTTARNRAVMQTWELQTAVDF